MEWEFEHLLMKARFGEAKIRDLVDSIPKNALSVSSVGPIQQIKVGHTPLKGGGQHGDRSRQNSKFGDRSRCFTCGRSGHFAKQCPQRSKSKSSEAPGRSLRSGYSSTVAQVASHDDNQGESRKNNVRQSQENELDDALTRVTATMHGIVTDNSERNAQLGPIPITNVMLEGVETEALLDTGSPVTIVSLPFLLEALSL